MNAVDFVTNSLSNVIDTKTIGDVVSELGRTHDSEMYDDLEVFFGANGQLLAAEPKKDVTDYNNRVPYTNSWGRTGFSYGTKPNPDYRPPRDNKTFVDAIKFDGIYSSKVRHGRVNFTHLDGRETHMSFAQFRQVLPKLVRGWLVGEFCYRKYYRALEIYCIKVLV